MKTRRKVPVNTVWTRTEPPGSSGFSDPVRFSLVPSEPPVSSRPSGSELCTKEAPLPLRTNQCEHRLVAMETQRSARQLNVVLKTPTRKRQLLPPDEKPETEKVLVTRFASLRDDQQKVKATVACKVIFCQSIHTLCSCSQFLSYQSSR